MIKIGVLTITSNHQGGIHQYTVTLVEAFKLLQNKSNFKFIQIRYKNFPKILANDIIIDKISPLKIIAKHAIHEYLKIPIRMLKFKIPPQLTDINLIVSPIISLLPYYLQIPYIVTIHDFQHKYYPNFFSFIQRMGRKILYQTAKYANKIIVESKFVEKDIYTFLKLKKNKVVVLPSPPPPYIANRVIDLNKLTEIRQKYHLPNNYIFYPAQFWYHKNHVNLLESLYLIKKRYRIIIPLVLVGSKKNNFENVMRKINELDLSKSVKYLGYVPDEDMPYLYKLSTALVMPTLFESVSIPLWEAFYLGVPVVSSNVCALPEQVGDAGLLFDPNNVEDMAEKIYRIWIDKDLRKELIQRGFERIKDLTLEKYAKDWGNIISKVLEEISES